VDRPELADFLRRCRARLTPAEVRLAPGSHGRRRTPGLRREEASLLAGISVDYWTRLEQARGPRPSPGVLAALAEALRLSAAERDHLFRLAGQAPPPAPPTGGLSGPHPLSPALSLVLARLHDAPALVLTAYGDVLAQNAASVALSGDLLAGGPAPRNLVRSFFTDPAARALFPAEDRARHARAHVAELRGLCSARPGDPGPARLVAELRAASGEFDRLWERHEVADRHADRKRLLHPVAGPLDLDCETLVSPGGDQRLLVHSPRPGTGSAERLRRLVADRAV
jgi:hypothetical protein